MLCGTNRYYRLRGASGFARWVDEIGYNTVAFAPSEFYTTLSNNSSGYDAFASFATTLPTNTRVIGSNVVAVPGSAMDGVFRPFRVVVAAGVKVGIISLVSDKVDDQTGGDDNLEMVVTPGNNPTHLTSRLVGRKTMDTQSVKRGRANAARVPAW